MTDKKVNVAVVGATGEVGQAMLSILDQRDFPVAGLHVVASSRSAGKTIEFRDEELVVEDLDSFDFSGIDIGLFSPGLPYPTSTRPGPPPPARSSSTIRPGFAMTRIFPWSCRR